MALTPTGEKIKAAYIRQHGEKNGEAYFAASLKSGRLRGVEGTQDKPKVEEKK